MKNFITRLSIIYSVAVLFSCILISSCVTDKYDGYKLVEKKFVKEVNADCILLEHEQSGARIFKIMADDPNKLFAVAFKTVPDSDCGTPHIIEHSVLNGSTNFPVKSPFDVLSQGSLNTFLNAMTGADMTVYPVASMNDKDYFNLMHVYLDAVFNPLIYEDERIFMQEGWHYELSDDASPLLYKGVVYNEMKGAFSDPARELGYQVMKNLYPDNCYRFSSGGYPAAIPELSYQEFLDFHSRHYHPSNSYILLYGDADLTEELRFIDENYLSDYERAAEKVIIKEQAPFEETQRVVSAYPVMEGSDLQDKTYLQLSIVTGHATEYAKNMALDVISDVVVNQESAPLRHALREAGIGSNVSAYVDDNKQNAFNIIVYNANEEDLDRFYDITMETFQKVVDEGIDNEAVEGTINRLEFNLREGNTPQKGLIYGMQLLHGWFFEDNPFIGLEYEKPLQEIKSSYLDNYMEDIIASNLIGNNHAVLLALKPMPGLQAKLDNELASKLEGVKEGWEDDKINSLVAQTNELIGYQKRADSPEALASIPLLSLEDISKEAGWYEAEKREIDGTDAIFLEEFTSDIVYTRLLFDMKVLSQEQIQYAKLLSELFGKFDTENYDYGDIDNQLKIHTGGFGAGISVFTPGMDDSRYIASFVINSRAVESKVPKMFELSSEIMFKSKIDKERLAYLLNRHFKETEMRVLNNGLQYAATRMFSYCSYTGRFNEQLSGFEYYWFLSDLVENFDNNADTIIETLYEVSSLLFNKSIMDVNITCSEDNYNNFTRSFTSFSEMLPDSPPVIKEWTLKPEKKNEGFMTTSKVQYVLKGANYKSVGYDWSGKLSVLNQILSTDWLQNQVRVIGGAYGGFSNFGTSGNMFFASYRDPNLKETLDNYDSTPGFLESFDADQKAMTRFIIGTISSIDVPETPSMKGNVALNRYYNGITRDFFQTQRDDILSTTADDIRNMKNMVQDLMAQDIYCVYGNREKIELNKDLFMELVDPVK